MVLLLVKIEGGYLLVRRGGEIRLAKGGRLSSEGDRQQGIGAAEGGSA
jgi:hypothetical protein